MTGKSKLIQRFFIILLLALIGALPLKAFAATVSPLVESAELAMGKKDPFYVEIEAYAKDPKKDVVAFINANVKKNPQFIFPAVGWLRDNTFKGRDGRKTNAMYFLTYSDLLSNISVAYYRKNGVVDEADKTAKTAFLALETFELLALADAGRCDGVDAQSVLMPLLAPRYDKLKYVYKLLTPKEYTQSLREAVLTEARSSARAPNEKICVDEPDEEVPVEAVAPEPDTAFHPDLPEKSKYVDDKVWDARRAQAVADFRSFMPQRYEDATGLKAP